MGRCVKIVEVTGGSTTSTKQFVWCGNERCEVRDATSALLSQYFTHGQVNVSSGVYNSYFYSKDHLGSNREMSDAAGTIVAELAYDAYGCTKQLAGDVSPDFQYCGYFHHQRSALNITRSRIYNAKLGRFLSRDPAGELGVRSNETFAPPTLYGYVSNDPVGTLDPLGLCGEKSSKHSGKEPDPSKTLAPDVGNPEQQSKQDQDRLRQALDDQLDQIQKQIERQQFEQNIKTIKEDIEDNSPEHYREMLDEANKFVKELLRDKVL